MNNRDRTTPVTLSGDTPVTQTINCLFTTRLFGLQCLDDRITGLLEIQTRVLTGFNGNTVLAPGIGQRQNKFFILRFDDGFYGQVIFAGELKVTFIMGRYCHNRATAISHQHIIRDPHRQGIASEGMLNEQTCIHTQLFLRGKIRLHHRTALTLFIKVLQFRVVFCSLHSQGMFRRYGHVRRAE